MLTSFFRSRASNNSILPALDTLYSTLGRLVFGFWLLAFGFWLLAFGFWLLAFGFWLLAFGFWLLAFGFWQRFYDAICPISNINCLSIKNTKIQTRLR